METIRNPNKIQQQKPLTVIFLHFALKYNKPPWKELQLHKTLTSYTDQIPENPIKYFINQFILTKYTSPKENHFGENRSQEEHLTIF